MGAQEWPVGTVAVATVRGVEGVRVVRIRDHHETSWQVVESLNGWLGHHDSDVTDVRPLVVLDLGRFTEDWLRLSVVERLRKLAETGNTHGLANTRLIITAIADQIETQTPRPKPAEPTGLGAVVRARDGLLWQRIDADPPWFHRDVFDKTWDQIDVAEILSEGVQP